MIAVLAVGLVATLPSQAAGRKKNPTGKLYVADVNGTVEIDNGETIAEITKHSVYTAQGTVIETKADSNNVMVFSNGTAISFGPDTRLEIRKFVQEPFTPNRSDMEVEPSISTTDTFLPRGAVSLCTSKLVAGSTMNYATPHANISVKGSKVVIDSNAKGTTVSLLGGEVTVQAGEFDSGGKVLEQGQQAFIPADGGPVQIQPIPQDQAAALDDKVTMACMARKTVYFDVSDQKVGDGQDGAGSDEITAFDTSDESDEGTGGSGPNKSGEIVVKRAATGETPIQFTVSAATIPTTN